MRLGPPLWVVYLPRETETIFWAKKSGDDAILAQVGVLKSTTSNFFPAQPPFENNWKESEAEQDNGFPQEFSLTEF